MGFFGVLGDIATGFLDGVSSVPIIGGILKPFAQAISSPIKGAQAQAATNEQREWAEYMQNLGWQQSEQSAQNQRYWSAEQAGIARDFAAQQAQLERDFNSFQAAQARNWNGLDQQVLRAQGVGINPGAIIGNSGTSAAVASQSGSPSVVPPSGAAGAAGVAPGSIPNGLLNLQALESVLKMRNESTKIQKETGRYDEVTDATLRKIESEIAVNAAQKGAIEIANAIQRVYGKRRAAAECLELEYRAYKSAADGDLAEAKQLTETMMARLYQAQDKEIRLKLPFIEAMMKQDLELVAQQTKTEKAKQADAYASAQEHKSGSELKSAEAETENVLREHKVTLTKRQIEEAAAKVGLTENQAAKALADAVQAQDKAAFLSNNPKIKRLITILSSIGDAASLGVLKGLLK